MTDLIANSVLKDNENLVKDLKITRKLLETYRNCLISFTKRCKCVANKENKTKFNKLEEYFNKFNHKIAINCENTTVPMAEVEPNNRYLLRQRKALNSSEDFIDENEISKIFSSDNDYKLLKLKSTNEKNNKKEDKRNSKPISKNKVLKRFVCDFCGKNKSFRSNYHLVRHIRSCHSLEKPYKCLKCLMKFSLSERLSQHIKIYHKDYQKFRCNQQNCNFETIIEERLTAHSAKHRKLRRVKCDACVQSFLTNFELKCHKKKFHFDSDDITNSDPMMKTIAISDSNRVLCDSNVVIDGSFFDTFIFDQNSPENQTPTQVSVEQKSIRIGSEVKKLLKPRKHKKHKVAALSGDVFCEERGCGKKFLSQYNLRKHMRTVHSNIRPYICEWPGCDSAFKTREGMNCHLAAHRNERNHPCDVEGCDKRFNTRQELHQHKRCHGINKIVRYPCSWPACDVLCQSAQALSEHINRHQNIRPFKCDYEDCDKSYFTSYELRQHVMKTHDKSKSFRCDYIDCTMSYLNKRDLSKHRRLHEDMASFVCSWPECSHTFNTSRDLSDHLNRHMDIKANKCSFVGCDRSYFKKANLNRHIKQSHSVNTNQLQ